MMASLYFDDCILDICQQTCEYCRREPTTVVDNFFVTGKVRFSNEDALRKVRESIDRGYTLTDAPILKISGYGEVLLIEGIVELLRGYERVIQIMTNGKELDRVLPDIRESRINLCISLDGHTQELNRARAKTEKHQNRVVDNLLAVSELQIPVEINSVLTKYNTGDFFEFLDWLLHKNVHCLVYPFPVRNNYLYGRGNDLYPERRDIKRFSKCVLETYDEYQDILPPYPYMERLTAFLHQRKRSEKCYIGLINFCVDPQGNILKCCCGWNEIIGNIFDENQALPSFSEKMVHDTNFPAGCADCFTHYELVNCFLDGEIPLDDMMRVKLFREEAVRERLVFLKKIVENGDF